MKISVKKEKDCKVVNWANGTSTELFVFPADGNFQTRDFTFRISTATVEAEKTTFSDFSSLTRILMILEGNIKLIHEGRYTKQLAPFDQDTFDGSWPTKSQGKVRDFNVMFKENVEGKVEHLALKPGLIESFMLAGTHDFFFVQNGLLRFKDLEIQKNDLLIIEREESESIDLECLEAGDLVKVEIKLK
jgi:environmental stress-induced protein Ves